LYLSISFNNFLNKQIVSATTIPGQDVQGTAQVTKSLGLLAQDSLSAIPAELSCGQLGQELFEIKLASTLCFIDNGGGKRFVSGN